MASGRAAGLRALTLRGGAYLLVREAVGLALRVGGILVLSRLIGPTGYGLYAVPLAVTTVLATVGWMGADVFLIRQPDEPPRRAYDQAFSFLLVSGTLVAALGLAATVLAGPGLLDPRYRELLRVMLLTLPVNVTWIPAQAMLERRFDYRRLARIEVGSDATFYGGALLLAWRGAGAWSPVAGYCCMQVWMLLAGCALARYRPRLAWSGAFVRELLGYGFSYSMSNWVARLRLLVAPLVVGHDLGPQAVGHVALAIRMVENLGFVTRITSRVSVVALANVQQDLARARRALEEAMALQLLVLGALLGGFAMVANWLVPLLLGPAWSRSLAVYGFLAAGSLVYAVFSLHQSLLYVLRGTADVALWAVLHLALLAAAAVVLVPRLGLAGYGWAELVSLASYAVLHAGVRRRVGVGYRGVLPWAVACGPLLLALATPLPWRLLLLAPAAAVALLPSARRQALAYAGYLRLAVRRGRATGSDDQSVYPDTDVQLERSP
ncbi:MAG TPA: oligosaccharide flippase family protein [Actinomycetes bacterium]